MADGASHDVGRHGQREAEAEDAAKHHQHQLEPVERPPLQMTLPLQHQFVGDGHLTLRRPGQASSASASRDPQAQTSMTYRQRRPEYLTDKPRRMGPGFRRDDTRWKPN